MGLCADNDYLQEVNEVCNSTCTSRYSGPSDCFVFEEKACIENSACIWEPPESDSSDFENDFTTTVQLAVADDLCPKAAEFVSSSSAKGDNNLFDIDRVCSIVCGDLHREDCSDILKSVFGAESEKGV